MASFHVTVSDSVFPNLDPARQVVAGFQPLMPTFRSQLSEAQVLQLIAYIRTLGTPPAPSAEQP